MAKFSLGAEVSAREHETNKFYVHGSPRNYFGGSGRESATHGIHGAYVLLCQMSSDAQTPIFVRHCIRGCTTTLALVANDVKWASKPEKGPQINEPAAPNKNCTTRIVPADRGCLPARVKKKPCSFSNQMSIFLPGGGGQSNRWFRSWSRNQWLFSHPTPGHKINKNFKQTVISSSRSSCPYHQCPS